MTPAELIAALEAAEGPKFILDCEIHAVVLGGYLNRHGAEGIFYTIGGLEHAISAKAIPAYTASIDAALSFTPEGASVQLDLGLPDGKAGALITMPEGEPDLSIAATPAIALCIANLRALEAQE